MKQLISCITAFVLALATIPAHADTLFSNVTNGYDSLGSAVGMGYTVGEGFTPSATGTLTTIDVAMTQFYFTGTAATNPTITLYSNNAGAPGTALESWSPSYASLPVAYGVPQLTTLTSLLNPTLDMTSEYWLVATDSANTMVSWNYDGDYSSTGAGTGVDGTGPPTGGHYCGASPYCSYHAPDSISGGFDVNGTVASTSSVSATPEPSSLILLGTGLVGLGGLIRRRVIA